MTTNNKKLTFFPIEPRGNLECITSVSRETIGDDGRVLIDGIRNLYNSSGEGIPAGSDVLVKILNEKGDQLLHRRMFTVVSTGPIQKTGMDLRGIDRTITIEDYVLEPVGDWWSASKLARVEEEPPPKPEPERYVPGEAEAKWNPGKKTYEIRIGDRVLATERDKDRALAIAAGSEPLAGVA